MPGERTITCQDCGHHEETRSANTIRCAVCRLVANLLWVRSRTYKCWACETRFAPIARDDQLCANCTIPRAGDAEIDCVICQKHRRSVAQDIAVCVWCARDPQHRKRLFKALLTKQQDRRDNPPSALELEPVA